MPYVGRAMRPPWLAPLAAYGVLLQVLPCCSTRFCGNYCGPNWCNGVRVSESVCDDSVPPETHFGTPSCVDTCCKSHDACCGHWQTGKYDVYNCNRDMLKCLEACSHFSALCTWHGLPVTREELQVAIWYAEDWCCDAPCQKPQEIANYTVITA
mmetsp:Transcript_10520/g.23673  ORF Transcript_10520/g.23673 Transcript_10520/m.23673 type:complete len:154 (-) Transcript_10520:223-684(-)